MAAPGISVIDPNLPPASQRMSYYDAEMGGLGAGPSAFSEKAIRHGFIRKVYGILMVQLAITAAFIALFIFEPNVQLYSRQHPGLYISAMVITFVLMLVLACCESVRRSFPANLILLLLFTVCEGVLLGTVSSFYEVKEVMIAVTICTVVCLGLTLFAFQTKWDFTAMSGILFVCALVFMCFGFALIFIKGDIVRLVYACIGALLFSVYLVFDTQMMLGGNHKYALSPEEYIFAALSLYVDIINLFLMILQIVGYANRD
ncbi:glutamate NMDA receptor-associated protein 1 lifeguard isoform X1 [Haemaphysalis longicornis]